MKKLIIASIIAALMNSCKKDDMKPQQIQKPIEINLAIYEFCSQPPTPFSLRVFENNQQIQPDSFGVQIGVSSLGNGWYNVGTNGTDQYLRVEFYTIHSGNTLKTEFEKCDTCSDVVYNVLYFFRDAQGVLIQQVGSIVWENDPVTWQHPIP